MSQSPGRRLGVVVRFLLCVTVAGLGLGLLAPAAEAVITTPAHGSTVRGIVQIHENKGGEYRDSLLCGRGPANTAIEVRLPNGTLLHRWEKGMEGSFTVNWDSIGRENLTNYQVISYGRDRYWSSFSCRDSGWYTISNIRVHLDNRAVISYTGPTSGYWQENAPLQARLTESTTGRAIAGRTVTFGLDGQPGEVTATTGSTGFANASLPLSRDPGSTLVRARFDQDCCFRAAATAPSFNVLKRPTTLTYTGEASVYADEPFSASATLTDTRNGATLPDEAITFEVLDGADIVEAATVTTDPDGSAEASFDADLDAGAYVIRASFAATPLYGGAVSTSALVVLPRPTTLEYVGDASGYWLEDAAVSARLVDVLSGEALADREVDLALGTLSAQGTTDGEGTATTVIALEDQPGIVDVTVEFGGGPRHAPATDATSFEILKRPTALAYHGDLGGARGETKTLAATLTDERADAGLEGYAVTFTLGSVEEVALTDADGVASVDVPLDQDPGSYTATVAYDGDDFYLASDIGVDFALGWQFTFTDALGRGTVHLNPLTNEFRISTPDGQTSIKHDPSMLVVSVCETSKLLPSADPPAAPCANDAVAVTFSDDEAMLTGLFELNAGTFTAVADTEFGTLVLAGTST